MKLSADQQRAFDEILAWVASKRATLTFGGLAGTGKTTLVRELLRQIGSDGVAVCAPTGKAASVLRYKGVRASTVHRLIYSPQSVCVACNVNVQEDDVCPRCKSDDDLSVVFARVHEIAARLIVVDEASMLDVTMKEDLESFQVPILYVGDHGQLQPVGEDPGLLADPQVRLEQVHRQAEGSPIIKFAHHVRTNGQPAAWVEDGDVRVRIGLRGIDWSRYDAVLCGFNNTRLAVNAKVREIKGFEGPPQVGERLICLQNNSDMGLFNGMGVTVTHAHGQNDTVYVLDLEDEAGDTYRKVPALRSQFGNQKRPEKRMRSVGLFDFGYALTTHKSQGSQWPRVAVLEQIAPSWSPSRWRYTAATRAQETLHYFLSARR